MKKLFSNVISVLEKGETVVLCTIVDSNGSTPRGAGAKMAVYADGRTDGTIGGGAVEYQSIQTALEVHQTGRSRRRSFLLHQNPVDDIGMICGGDVVVFFQYLVGAENVKWLAAAQRSMAQREDCWLITEISGDDAWRTGLSDGVRYPLSGVRPAEFPQALCRRKPVLCGTAPACFAEPISRSGRVYVFGGGHVSQETVPLLSHLDFSVIVCESRSEFADKALFPTADEVVLAEFSGMLRRFSIQSGDCLIVMTRGHRDDYLVLRQALETGAGYIGVIGSRRKAALTFERLRGDGFDDAALARVHTPIGLPINAETPAEIAVSIAAELIRHRASFESDKT